MVSLLILSFRFGHGSIEIAHLQLICLIHGKNVRLVVTSWCRACLTRIRSLGVFFGALFLVVGWVLKAKGLLHDQKQLFNSTIFVIFEIFKTLDLVHDSAVHRCLV
jgi:hypothetical protein